MAIGGLNGTDPVPTLAHFEKTSPSTRSTISSGAGTESRMAGFMELAATAIANAQAEEELRELADTQAALRRLTALVARGEPPEVVFAAATREVLRISAALPPG
jgi:hypothetical protein